MQQKDVPTALAEPTGLRTDTQKTEVLPLPVTPNSEDNPGLLSKAVTTIRAALLSRAAHRRRETGGPDLFSDG